MKTAYIAIRSRNGNIVTSEIAKVVVLQYSGCQAVVMMPDGAPMHMEPEQLHDTELAARGYSHAILAKANEGIHEDIRQHRAEQDQLEAAVDEALKALERTMERVKVRQGQLGDAITFLEQQLMSHEKVNAMPVKDYTK